MILEIILILLFVCLLYSFEIFKHYSITKIISAFLGIIIFYLLLFNVTYNHDWNQYTSIYNGYIKSKDLLFGLLSNLFSNLGYKYVYLYRFHIFCIGLGLIYFISRFSFSYVFSVLSIYLLFQVVPLSNQIRYFLAFSFFLISVYSLICKQNKLGFIFGLILAVASHMGILLMYPFLYFYYKIDTKKYLGKIILCSIIITIIVLVFYSFALVLFPRFSFYLGKKEISSFVGGLFNNFIWLFWYVFIIIRHRKLVNTEAVMIGNNGKELKIEHDVKYNFLYKLSIYGGIFYPISFFIQILCNRFITPSIIVWAIYLMYSLKYENDFFEHIRLITKFLLVVIFTFVYMYILPGFLGIENNKALFEIFRSNKDIVSFFTFFTWLNNLL
ncbi:MAG: EpsG family protein [Bacteroidales bacterium]|nr:EpsG family protein [Bacteroidales bacterium]